MAAALPNGVTGEAEVIKTADRGPACLSGGGGADRKVISLFTNNITTLWRTRTTTTDLLGRMENSRICFHVFHLNSKFT